MLGYPHAVFRGMKGYNGVAIFSRRPIELLDLAPDWCAKGDCRHIAVLVDAKGGPVEPAHVYSSMYRPGAAIFPTGHRT